MRGLGLASLRQHSAGRRHVARLDQIGRVRRRNVRVGDRRERGDLVAHAAAVFVHRQPRVRAHAANVKSLLGVRAQAAGDQLATRARQKVGNDNAALDNLLVERRRRFGLEWQKAAHCGVQNHAERPQVDRGAGVLLVLNLRGSGENQREGIRVADQEGGLQKKKSEAQTKNSSHHLWCRVRWRSARGSHLLAKLDRVGQTEIGNLDGAVAIHENVFQFQVAVNNLFAVAIVDAGHDLLKHAARLLGKMTRGGERKHNARPSMGMGALEQMPGLNCEQKRRIEGKRIAQGRKMKKPVRRVEIVRRCNQTVRRRRRTPSPT